MASECVASVIVADQETLEQIQLDESEFYGTDSYDEDQPSMIVADDHDSEDELLSLSEDETSTREGIRSMSMPKKEPNYHFHADNCVGQNKNKSVLAYFMWRTYIGGFK